MSLRGPVLRRVGLDRNPLRRTVDRVEWWLTFTLVLAFAAVAPATTWRVGRAAYAGGVHTEQVQRGQRVLVAAVLLVDADEYGADDTTPREYMLGKVPAATTRIRAPASWTTPDGRVRSGLVPVPAHSPAGATVPVWIRRDGSATGPPQMRGQTVSNAVGAGILVALGSLWLAVSARLLLRYMANRRRLAAWQADWLFYEPRWSGRS